MPVRVTRGRDKHNRRAECGPGSKYAVSVDTILPADSVEFCPHPHASNILVCGTYQLQEEQNPSLSSSASGPAINAGHQNQIRTGQCLVFEVDSEQEIISACVRPPFLLIIFMGVLVQL
jgi:hypothetical protein